MNTYNSNELQHHGVMGMKWGVRRYQNKDGTLTAKGKARFDKVASNERLQKRETKAAIKMYKRNKNQEAVELNTKVLNRKVEKLKEKGDTTSEKFKQYTKMAEYYTKRTEAYNKAIKDLETGKVKAGRDFIVQKDYDLYLIGPYVTVNKTTRLIEK